MNYFIIFLESKLKSNDVQNTESPKIMAFEKVSAGINMPAGTRLDTAGLVVKTDGS